MNRISQFSRTTHADVFLRNRLLLELGADDGRLDDLIFQWLSEYHPALKAETLMDLWHAMLMNEGYSLEARAVILSREYLNYWLAMYFIEKDRVMA